MWALMIVFNSPVCDLPPGIPQILEPACTKALIAQTAVKILDVSIWGRLSRLNMNRSESLEEA
jgi:hypothetical protein